MRNQLDDFINALENYLYVGKRLYRIIKAIDPSCKHLIDYEECYYETLSFFEEEILRIFQVQDDDIARDGLAEYLDNIIHNDNKNFEWEKMIYYGLELEPPEIDGVENWYKKVYSTN